jgi:hypothetical protein
MMMGHNTQCGFEFLFGPPATQIEHGKSTSADNAKEGCHFGSALCQLTFTDQARATLKICP